MEGRIFVSKLLHGPGNALTYYSCKQRVPYISNPSNWLDSLQRLDGVFGLNSKSAVEFLRKCEKGVDFNTAPKLLSWYEHLVAAVLHGGDDSLDYDSFCEKLAQ